MKKLSFIKYTFRTIIITAMVVYFGLIALPNIPSVQQGLSDIATRELRKLLDTEVSIGNIDLGLLNRIIIQDLVLYDRSGKEMLNVARFSAKFDILAIAKGKISINSIQLFGLDALLNKKDKETEPNFKFVTDLFASKDKKKKSNFIDLRINSILIRRSNIKYDVLSEKETTGLFNPHHIGINNLSVNISVKALSSDSINVKVKRVALDEKSGFKIKKLSLSAIGNGRGITVSDFNLATANSLITADGLKVEYDSLNAIKDINAIGYSGVLEGKIFPSDASVFVPALENMDEPLDMGLKFHNENNCHILDYLYINTGNKDISLGVNGKFIAGTDSASRTYTANIKELRITENAINRISGKLKGMKIPALVSHIGTTSINGSMRGNEAEINNNLSVKTSIGNVEAKMKMYKDANSQKRSFAGLLKSETINLGKLLGKKQLGEVSFDVDLNGLTYNDNNMPESYVKGVVKYIDINGYRYHNIMMDGQYVTGGFDGNISIDDPNAKINIDGSFNTSGKIPVFKLTANIDRFRPDNLKLTNRYVNTEYSLKIGADFTGNNIDNINGNIRIDSLNAESEDDEYDYFLPSFNLTAGTRDSVKTINIKSGFLNGEVKGVYSYKTLSKSILRVAQRYMPSLLANVANPKDTTKVDNNFKIDMTLDNTDFLSKMLRIPVKINMPGTLSGYIDDKQSKVFINANIPDLSFKGKKYESITLLLENPGKELHCHLRTNILMKKGTMMSVSMNGLAYDDMMSIKTFWGNNTNVTYSGEFSANAAFSKDSITGRLHTDVDILPGEVVLNDSVWNVHQASISIDKDSIEINNFLFDHKEQHVKINGRIGKKASDLCLVDLNNVSLKYVMDMIQFHAVEFEGNTSGKVYLSSVFDKPILDARLNVDNFSLNGAALGNAEIKGGFDNVNGRILLDADIRDGNNVFTIVKGYISPKEKGLDLDINAGGTNLAFLGHFVKSIFSDMEGRAYGKARLYGPFKQLDIEGKVKANLGMKVNILNTRFEASADSVNVKSGEFMFENVRLTDAEGNTGTANGYLRHNKLKNLNYTFRFDTNNMKVLHAEENNTDFPFYGDVYATGTTTISGNETAGLLVESSVVAENNTSFVYVLGAASEAIDKQFITFVDKTPKRRQEEIQTELYHYLNSKNTNESEDETQNIRINMMIEPSQMAEMKIIMDPLSGDYISARGTGSLRVNYFNKGDFQIFGNYNINEGIYKLSMQNVIRKDFVLRQGGTVSFNGDPKSANLNLQAAYTVPSASLNDLLADAASTRGNVRVNCLVNLSGPLTSPNLGFDLELPTVNEEDRQLVKSLTSTPEQMTTQIIYLLGVGKFYTYDYAATQNNQSNATSSLAFSTLSGQLNNMLSQVIDSQNWNFGTNLSTGQNGWTDVEAEAMLSGKLLNNRLIINGNFGYRENTLRNTNFVGDFEAIWLLTKNGDFRLRGYNQTNDRYFTKSTLTTQGMGLIYKKDFTKWNELIDWVTNFKLYRKKKLEKNKSKDKE